MVDHTRRAVLAAAGTGLAMSTSATVGGARDEATAEDDGVRLVHLSPDAPAVDVHVDGELAVENLEPFATQSDYLPYDPGSHALAVVPAGEDPESALLETEVDLDGGEYTLAAVGEACATSERPLRIVTLDDDNGPTGEGAARIRAVHASPDAPAVDVLVEGEALAEGLDFGESGSAEIPAGEAVAEVRDTDRDERIARFALEPEAGTVYTGFGVGYLDPSNAPENGEEISFALAVTEDATPGER